MSKLDLFFISYQLAFDLNMAAPLSEFEGIRLQIK